MYSVYLSNKGEEPLLIYDERVTDDITAMISPQLDIESGQAGSFDATLPVSNRGYNFIEPLKSEIIVKKNGTEKWRGRVLNPEIDFFNQMKIEVEGELTYLTDTYQPQHEYKTETLRQVIEGILSIHNNKVGDYDANTGTWTPKSSEPIDKIFYVGAVFVSESGDPTGTDVSYRTTDYDTTLNCLKKIGDAYKGYFIVRRDSQGKRYLDFVKDFSTICQQRIDFGANLLDYSKTFKMEDLCTVALPIGAAVNDTDFTEADEMYIYRTEDNREINYLSGADFQTRLDPGDHERGAGVVYFNEYGLHADDKVYVSLYNRKDTALDPKDGMWAFSGPNGIPSTSDATHRTNQNGDYEVVEKKELKIPAGCDRLRVGWYVNSEFSPKVYKQKAESGLDEHFTIAPQGEVDDDNFKHTPGDPYLIYKPLYDLYGWHEKKLEFSNLKTSSELWDMATYWLQNTQFTQMTLDVTALDLSMMNASYDDIWINMNVPIYSKPHGITDSLLLPCTKMSVKLGDPENTSYTLGYTTPKAISDTQRNVNADISKLLNDVPNYSDTLKSIQENATQIIDSMYGEGYVTFLHDIPNSPSQISAIVISNNADPEQATKKWVWNEGGFGYQHRDNVNDSWSNFDTAITMDGTILAKFIAAHTLTADKLWGGTLTLGHLTYTDPVTQQTITTDGELIVKRDNGNEMLTIKKDYGLTVNSTDAWARIKNGRIYGNSFSNPDPIQEGNEDCSGVINFHNPYSDGANSVYGVDIRSKIFGINTDSIWVSREYGGPAATGKHLLDFEVNGKRLTFWKGILIDVVDVNANNGGD